MRALRIYLVLAALAVQPAGADAYTELALYRDPAGEYCNLIDDFPRPQYVYVFVDYSTGTLGTRFRVVPSESATLTYLDETPNALYAAGDTETGITLCFAECVVAYPQHLIVTILYLGLGTSSMCSDIRVQPAPGAPYIESVTCDGQVERAYAWHMSINDDGITCPCYRVGSETRPHPQTSPRPLTADDNFCAGVPVEETTWGRVKSLYK
jgi:hypothetical protein